MKYGKLPCFKQIKRLKFCLCFRKLLRITQSIRAGSISCPLFLHGNSLSGYDLSTCRLDFTRIVKFKITTKILRDHFSNWKIIYNELWFYLLILLDDKYYYT